MSQEGSQNWEEEQYEGENWEGEEYGEESGSKMKLIIAAVVLAVAGFGVVFTQTDLIVQNSTATDEAHEMVGDGFHAMGDAVDAPDAEEVMEDYQEGSCLSGDADCGCVPRIVSRIVLPIGVVVGGGYAAYTMLTGEKPDGGAGGGEGETTPPADNNGGGETTPAKQQE